MKEFEDFVNNSISKEPVRSFNQTKERAIEKLQPILPFSKYHNDELLGNQHKEEDWSNPILDISPTRQIGIKSMLLRPMKIENGISRNNSSTNSIKSARQVYNSIMASIKSTDGKRA